MLKSHLKKISQSDESVLIQIDENKAVWIAQKYIHPQLPRLTLTEKSKDIKLDVNNRDYILKGLYTFRLCWRLLYDVMTSTKDASGKALALQAEKYSDQCYKKYLAEKQKINKPKSSNLVLLLLKVTILREQNKNKHCLLFPVVLTLELVKRARRVLNIWVKPSILYTFFIKYY